jgi:hypothetical protein
MSTSFSYNRLKVIAKQALERITLQSKKALHRCVAKYSNNQWNSFEYGNWHKKKALDAEASESKHANLLLFILPHTSLVFKTIARF